MFLQTESLFAIRVSVVLMERRAWFHFAHDPSARWETSLWGAWRRSYVLLTLLQTCMSLAPPLRTENGRSGCRASWVQIWRMKVQTGWNNYHVCASSYVFLKNVFSCQRRVMMKMTLSTIFWLKLMSLMWRTIGMTRQCALPVSLLERNDCQIICAVF